MNFLAHAYLSFHHPSLLVGNMISDFVKGKKQFDYSIAIQKGIQLHRAIDTFTDEHQATKQAKLFLKPVVGLYAGAFIDIVYDHFLAIDTHQFKSDKELAVFAANTYHVLDNHLSVLPIPFQEMLPHMKQQNWLYNYQFIWGIEKSFAGLVRRANYLQTHQPALEAFQINYKALKESYDLFFPDVLTFAQSLAQQLK